MAIRRRGCLGGFWQYKPHVSEYQMIGVAGALYPDDLLNKKGRTGDLLHLISILLALVEVIWLTNLVTVEL